MKHPVVHFAIGALMDKHTVFPDKKITPVGALSSHFLDLGIQRFLDACQYVYDLPYGYNSDREDLMVLFKEHKGSCTTKHAVIATLAKELGLPVDKFIGIYAMDETIVAGTNRILEAFNLPFLPMVHCFLKSGLNRVDLTQGNDNGKKRPVDQFLYTKKVIPHISGKDEYLLYRKALKDQILQMPELKSVEMKQILQAREKGLVLLKSKITDS